MPNRIIDGLDHPLHRTGLYIPLACTLLTAVNAVLFFHLGDRRMIDLVSTAAIAFAFIQGVLVIASLTEDWKWRIGGLLVAVGGTGLTYGFLFANASGYTQINTLAIRSILRSALFTGSIVLIPATWGYLYNRHRLRHAPQPPEGYLDPREHYR